MKWDYLIFHFRYPLLGLIYPYDLYKENYRFFTSPGGLIILAILFYLIVFVVIIDSAFGYGIFWDYQVGMAIIGSLLVTSALMDRTMPNKK